MAISSQNAANMLSRIERSHLPCALCLASSLHVIKARAQRQHDAQVQFEASPTLQPSCQRFPDKHWDGMHRLTDVPSEQVRKLSPDSL